MARKKIEKITEEAKEIAEEVVETVQEEIKDLGLAKEKKKKSKVKEESSEEKPKKLTKEELLERAKKLGANIGGEVKTEEIKEQLEKERKTLVPVEDYIKYGSYIGTKVITPHMRPYVYKRRNDGIAIFDVNKIDSRIKDFVKKIVKYNPENFILVCKREAGWNAVKKFAEVLGVRIFTKKYPAGILTNSVLPNFFETEMVFVVDPWLDKNAMKDARIIKKEVLGLCDTNNYTFDIDFFIPCNNKSAKSIGLMLHIIAREYMKEKGIDKKLPSVEEFIGEDLQEQ